MKSKEQNLFPYLVLVFLVSRFVLVAIGYLSMFYFPSARAVFPIQDLKYHAEEPASLEMWARWDSEWYLLIAEQGYDSYDSFRDFGHGRYLPQDTAKFFPLYPLLIRVFSFVMPSTVWSAVLLSNIGALFLLLYLWRLGSKLFDGNTAFQGGLCLIAFPTAFYLSAVYAESLFLAAIVAAFYYLEEKQLFPAVVAAFLASLARPQAILAIPALVWLAMLRFPERKWLAGGLVLVSMGLALGSFALYIHRTFGSVVWIANSQRYWRGEMKYPLYAIVRLTEMPLAMHGQHNSLLDLSFAVMQLLALATMFRKIPGPYYIYSIIVVLFPLSSTLFSFSRLCLANFPFFLYLGKQFHGRWIYLIQMAFAMLQAFFMAAYANWYWVG